MRIHVIGHPISTSPLPGAKPGDKSLKYFTDRKIQKLIPDSTFYPLGIAQPGNHFTGPCPPCVTSGCFCFILCVVGGTLSCSVFPLTRPSTATLVLSCVSHWICRSSLILATVCVGWLTIHFIMRPNGIMNVVSLCSGALGGI